MFSCREDRRLLSYVMLLVLVPVLTSRADNTQTYTPPFELVSRQKRYVAYPSGTSSGLFLGLAFPLPLPQDGVIFSYIFEANYDLPDNVTQYFPPSPSESLKFLNRKFVYDILRSKFIRAGLDGEECLLRLICDASLAPLHFSGLLGEILDVLLRPSTSMPEENVPSTYNEAEKLGSEVGQCSDIFPNCTVGIFDMLTVIEDTFFD